MCEGSVYLFWHPSHINSWISYDCGILRTFSP